jgi:RNA polymerase sigma factor (sigma-70 family)
MNDSTQSATSTSLLIRLQQIPPDQTAWEEFVTRYGHLISGWCRRWGLQTADADDVTQIVLMKLIRALQVLQYDPAQKFRGWLKTVAHHAWRDLTESRRQAVLVGDGGPDGGLQVLAARDDLAVQLNGAYEQELLDLALARVRLRVESQTWDAFRMTALEKLAGAEVATRLGMRVTSVYKAKSNVQKLLKAEVRFLEGDEP